MAVGPAVTLDTIGRRLSRVTACCDPVDMTLMALAALALAVGLVEVEGVGECPRASEVAERLRALLPDQAPDVARDRALLAGRGGELEVTLLGPRGESLASRRIPATAPCGELAAAAAVM